MSASAVPSVEPTGTHTRIQAVTASHEALCCSEPYNMGSEESLRFPHDSDYPVSLSQLSLLCRKMFLEISFPLVGASPKIFWAPSQWAHLDGGRVADITSVSGWQLTDQRSWPIRD